MQKISLQRRNLVLAATAALVAGDSWQHHAPMPTPRHAVGAALIGDWVYVAGGGAVLGGSVQSAVHEAFTLG